MNRLDELRGEINNLDSKLVKLLSERRELSKEVIKVKNVGDKPIRDKKRESEILKNIIQKGKEVGLDSHYITRVFYEIIEDSVRLQNNFVHNLETQDNQNKTVSVAIQGIEGAYSYLAAKKYFSAQGISLKFFGKTRFDDVIKSVENGEADYAVLPIENTTSGGINEVYDLLLHTTLSIVGEEKFHVKHCLAAVEDIPIKKITKIYAHYQAAAQCSKFLDTLTNCSIEYFADTAMSVKKIKEEGIPTHGAIASEEASEFFDVKIIRDNIANQSENYTRFLILNRTPVEVDARIPSKTSLVMSTPQEAGALAEALLVFKKYSINLTKLESRPIIGNPWEEMFYLDFEGSLNDDKTRHLLDELGKFTRFFKILGNYPSQEVRRTKLDKFVNPDMINTADIETNKTEELSSSKSPAKPKDYKLASRHYKAEDTVITIKDVEIGGDNFIVIAGPCLVESQSQIMTSAAEVKEHGGHILRGGCFKQHTSPHNFNGLEFEGLRLLRKAGDQYNLPIITEVLSPEQVREVAEYSDILQIGARNMQNFSLLKEVGRVPRPVMLIRETMSSPDELLNSAEYILSQGNRQVILCESGIRTFEVSARNTLDLSAIPVLKELTHLPIIVDPSSAAVERNKVIPLAKAAKIVGAHGIMVEIHPEPEKALSEGQHALYFNQFEKLMNDLQKL